MQPTSAPTQSVGAAARALLLSPRRRRATMIMPVILIAACAAILLAGVVAAQVSQNYDLACRSVLDSGGGARITQSNNYALIDATGQPFGGIVQSGSYGIYSGYIHPTYPGAATVLPTPSPAANELNLPFIAKAVRIVRGGC